VGSTLEEGWCTQHTARTAHSISLQGGGQAVTARGQPTAAASRRAVGLAYPVHYVAYNIAVTELADRGRTGHTCSGCVGAALLQHNAGGQRSMWAELQQAPLAQRVAR
jgi:hypothetical protein